MEKVGRIMFEINYDRLHKACIEGDLATVKNCVLPYARSNNYFDEVAQQKGIFKDICTAKQWEVLKWLFTRPKEPNGHWSWKQVDNYTIPYSVLLHVGEILCDLEEGEMVIWLLKYCRGPTRYPAGYPGVCFGVKTILLDYCRVNERIDFITKLKEEGIDEFGPEMHASGVWCFENKYKVQ